MSLSPVFFPNLTGPATSGCGENRSEALFTLAGIFLAARISRLAGNLTFPLRDRTQKRTGFDLCFAKNIKCVHTCETFFCCEKNPRKCEQGLRSFHQPCACGKVLDFQAYTFPSGSRGSWIFNCEQRGQAHYESRALEESLILTMGTISSWYWKSESHSLRLSSLSWDRLQHQLVGWRSLWRV